MKICLNTVGIDIFFKIVVFIKIQLLRKIININNFVFFCVWSITNFEFVKNVLKWSKKFIFKNSNTKKPSHKFVQISQKLNSRCILPLLITSLGD